MCIEDKIRSVLKDKCISEDGYGDTIKEVSTLFEAEVKKEWEAWHGCCLHLSLSNICLHYNRDGKPCDFDKCPVRRK